MKPMKIISIKKLKFKNSANKIPKMFFVVFYLFYFSIVPNISNAITVNVSSPIVITATVSTGTNTGGGSGGGSGINLPTTVNFSGMAYPNSKVTILNNGNIAAITTADPAARFSVAINNLSAGTYNFSVFGEDIDKVKSLTFSFPIYVTEGTTINISGIFLSPTISIDKTEVKKGDPLTVYGQTAPNVDVNIVFNSDQEIIKKIKTDFTGLYKYVMDTSPLEYGGHKVKSKTIVEEEVSAISAELPFTVGTISKPIDNAKCGKLIGDLNCDGRVNLTDFSIMAYWYKKAEFPLGVDLNNDGKISLIDFSIMAFNWTG